MMAFKYSLILLRHSSTDSVLFLSLLLSNSTYLLLQKLYTHTVYNNFLLLLHAQKDS